MGDDRSYDAFEIEEFGNGLSHWPAANGGLWELLISEAHEWRSRCGSVTYTLSKHWLDFIQRRAEANFTLPQDFMSCRTPFEVWGVGIEFLQNAITDYQKEIGELGRLGIVIGSELVTPKPKSTARVDQMCRSLQ
jgi:hypothetical protein